jgi:hypothetical protein
MVGQSHPVAAMKGSVFLAVIGLSIGLVACGGSAPTPPTRSPVHISTAPTRRSTTAGGSTSRRPPTPPKLAVRFALTTSDGWTYAGELPFPPQTAAFRKDISSSPPGSAKVTASVSGQAIPSMTFSDTNPGRPNGPKLTVSPGMLAYRVGADLLTNSNHYDGPSAFGPCQIAQESGALSSWPFSGDTVGTIICQPGTSAGTSQDDGPESQIDALISQLKGEHPTYVLNLLDPTGNDCNIFITPSHQIIKSPTFPVNCGFDRKLTVSVGGSTLTTVGASSQ